MATLEAFLDSQGIGEVIVVDNEIPDPMSDSVLKALQSLSNGECQEAIGHDAPQSDDDAEALVNGLTATEAGRLVRSLMEVGRLSAEPDFLKPLLGVKNCVLVHTSNWTEIQRDFRKGSEPINRLFVIDREQPELPGKQMVADVVSLDICKGVLYLSKDFNDHASMTALQELLEEDGLADSAVMPFRRSDAVDGGDEQHILAGFQLALAAHPLRGTIDEMEALYLEVSKAEFDSFRDEVFLLACHRLLSHSIDQGQWPPEVFVSYLQDRIATRFLEKASTATTIVDSVAKLMTETWTEGDAVANLLKELDDTSTPDAFTFKAPSAARLPLAPGDIFELKKTPGSPAAEFVLLAQACDLAIRSTGSRSSPGEAFLAPIKDQDRKWISDSEAQFPREHAGQGLRVVKFNRAIRIPLEVLDLCVYNTDGIARADLSNEEQPHWHPFISKAWGVVRTRLESDAVKVRDLIAKLADVEGLPKQVEVDLGRYLRVPPELSQRVFFQLDDTSILYGIKRTKRLEASHARMVLERYARYQARPATQAELFMTDRRP